MTGAKTRARLLLSVRLRPVPSDERIPRRGKSESLVGWTEQRISRVRSTGECGAELWVLTRHLPPPAGIRAGTTQRTDEHEVRIRRTGRLPGSTWNEEDCGCVAAMEGRGKQNAGEDGLRGEMEAIRWRA